MYVSSNGRYPPYEIELLSNLAKENDIALIEDAAQSLGSFNPNGDHIGREGSVGSFSFSSPKIISTGQGGALITDDDNIYYYTGYYDYLHMDFGRPTILLVPKDDESILITPLIDIKLLVKNIFFV